MTSFSTDIRQLFRDRDVESMQSFFDLSSYQDVRDNAEAIFERLSDGTMPCDGPWSEAQTAQFKAWIEEGFPE
jgi:hypothetical protein